MIRIIWFTCVTCVSSQIYSQGELIFQGLIQTDRYSRGVFIEEMRMRTDSGALTLRSELDSIQIDFERRSGRISYYRWVGCKSFIMPEAYICNDTTLLYGYVGNYWVEMPISRAHLENKVLTIKTIEYRWPYRLTIFGGWRFGFIINGSYAKAKKIKGFNP